MSRKFVTSAVIPLAALFFVVGWFSYDWMLHFVTAKIAQGVSVASLQEAFHHRLIASISLACLGPVIGVGVLLGGRFSVSRRYGRFFLSLILVAVLTMSGWMLVLARRMAAVGEQFASTSSLSEISLSLTAIPLHEIGLIGSGCVLAAAIVLAIANRHDEQ